MRILSILIGLVVLGSCTTIDKSRFVGKSFNTGAHHMGGESYIEFKSDSTFLLVERGGLLYSRGTWQIADKKIILNSFSAGRQERYTGDTTAIYFEATNNDVIIKSKKKLLYKGLVYSLEE